MVLFIEQGIWISASELIRLLQVRAKSEVIPRNYVSKRLNFLAVSLNKD